LRRPSIASAAEDGLGGAGAVTAATVATTTTPPPIAAVVAGQAEAAAVAPARPRTAVSAIGGLGGRTLDSLRLPRYRTYFFAQFGAYAAMNMQMLANGYLVFILTGSFAALGVVSLARAVPGLVFAMPGGLLADRLPKKYVVQGGEFCSALLTLTVALLLTFDMLRFEHLLAASFAQGTIMAFQMPAQQAILPGLVGMRRLQNAVALGMGVMNVMQMVGPALAGFLLAAVGPQWAYFVMAGLFLYSVTMFFRVPADDIRVTDPETAGIARPGERRGPSPARAHGGPGTGRRGMGAKDILLGLTYAMREPVILMLLAANLAIVLFSMPYRMLLPGYVIAVLGGGPGMIGTLQAIGGIGSIVSIVVVAAMPDRKRGRVLIAATLIMGVALLAFAASTVVWVTALIMVVMSVGQAFRMSLSSVLLQTYVDDDYRGRVMSLYMMEMSLVSFATFGAGVLSEVIGPQEAFGAMALVLVAIAVALWAFVPRMRHLE